MVELTINVMAVKDDIIEVETSKIDPIVENVEQIENKKEVDNYAKIKVVHDQKAHQT